ncbi:MAG: hypothetical protein LQ342_006451 [Letrouitia transgressa]|nr:MAG: hypothetical protein LQ342_006451 [Letrouitia transgressa]
MQQALQIPEIVLLIASHLRATTLVSFRQTSSQIKAIVDGHLESLYPLIIRNESPIRVSLDIPAPEGASAFFYLRVLLRIGKAHVLAQHYVADQRKHRYSEFAHFTGRIPDTEEIARFTKGVLLVWTLVDLQRQVGPVEPKFDLPRPSKPAAHRSHSSVVQTFGRWGKKLDALATAASAFPRGSGPYSSISEAAQCTRLKKATQWHYIKSMDTLCHACVSLALLHMRRWVYSSMMIGDKQWKESWALQRGPAFVFTLCVNDDLRENQAARTAIDLAWRSRSQKLKDAENVGTLFDFCPPKCRFRACTFGIDSRSRLYGFNVPDTDSDYHMMLKSIPPS